MSAPDNPFIRQAHVDKPGSIGSSWWNKGLADASALSSRRTVVLALVASVAGVAALTAAAVAISDSGTREETRRAIDVQRDLGWSFGATSETVAFDTRYTTGYREDALPRLVQDLTPTTDLHRPWFQPTLFQAPISRPRFTSPDPDAQTPTPLDTAIKPIHTPTMIVAESAGAALALLVSQADKRVALIFDLDGPEAVSAAAGAAMAFDPVFLFGNWPHPRGVVAAHLTLAAAVFHQPQLVQAAKDRRLGSPPAFVLDRRRLASYTDDSEQFDNRWLASLPQASDLVAMEIKRVLYVAPTQSGTIDLRDVAVSLDDWARASIDVRAIALDAFLADPTDGSKVRFGGSAAAEKSFFAHYPWKSPAPPTVFVAANDLTAAWRPKKPDTVATDKTLGMVNVDVDKTTGLVVALHAMRSGSYNRSSSGWGGG